MNPAHLHQTCSILLDDPHSPPSHLVHDVITTGGGPHSACSSALQGGLRITGSIRKHLSWWPRNCGQVRRASSGSTTWVIKVSVNIGMARRDKLRLR
ncbi:hypothetical protein Acr_13g0000960 [Actinidia rufa]|uniref:Uncharacterized protein n=1 Tax=Actinidia rufa TaxID=165716 RepID=A0A7J0FJ25_9ERIC|nr:hypothetical protein Acr_13g0000960 [Actinidia rufa]